MQHVSATRDLCKSEKDTNARAVLFDEEEQACFVT